MLCFRIVSSASRVSKNNAAAAPELPSGAHSPHHRTLPVR